MCALLAAASGAAAADLPLPGTPSPIYVPAPPPFTWAGFYLGANGGFTWAQANSTVTLAGPLAVPATTTTSNGNAGLAGGQIGANLQYNRLVLGLEGDFDWSGLGKNSSLSCGAGCSLSTTSSLKWLATARLRAGATVVDRVLLYATGGVAVEPLSQSANLLVGGANTNLFNLNATGVGWTIGGGVESAITNNISAKIEYLYVDVGNLKASSPIGIIGGTVTQNARVTQCIVRGGFNYRFNFDGS